LTKPICCSKTFLRLWKRRSSRWSSHPFERRGVYFVTQNPLDLPETVLGQLGIGYSMPSELSLQGSEEREGRCRDVSRQPKLNVVKPSRNWESEKPWYPFWTRGNPTIVERALIYPPHSRLSPLNPEERTRFVRESVLYGHYEKAVDRESAYEKLKAKAEQMKMDSQEETAQKRRAAEPKSQTEQLLGRREERKPMPLAASSDARSFGSARSIFGGGRRR